MVLSEDKWRSYSNDGATDPNVTRSSTNFAEIVRSVKRGDIVGVQGHAGRTRTGQLSLWAESLTTLSPCLRIIPHVHYGLKDDEQRARQRHLDLILNRNTFTKFQKRFNVIRSLRSSLEDRGFVEVETPILHRSPSGGAVARPFQTHHAALNMTMDLRIAPELHLKRLLIAGFEKVFELGRVFRNEGVDRTHNPEFTMCEYYSAYDDYEQAANQLQMILYEISQKVLDKAIDTSNEPKLLQTIYDSRGKEITIDFGQPFERVDVWDRIEQQLRVLFLDEHVTELLPLPIELSTESAHRKLIELCDRLSINFGVDEQQKTAARCVEKLIEHLVESTIDPSKLTLLMHHPVVCSPLAREHRSRPGLAERFELFVAGCELANGYSELNDPIRQRDAFECQAASQNTQITLPDLDYVKALQHAMPPAAGVGIGVDRLVMLLTGTNSLRDVILFPTLRPSVKEEKSLQDDTS